MFPATSLLLSSGIFQFSHYLGQMEAQLLFLQSALCPRTKGMKIKAKQENTDSEGSLELQQEAGSQS